MKRICLFIVSVCLFFSSAFADGTKQLWPNTAAAGATPSPTAGEGYSKNQCFLALGSREGGNGESRPFARYQHSSKASCADEHRLWFRLKEGEKVCLGFGGYMPNGGTATNNPTNGTYGKVKYRISKAEEVKRAEQELPSSGTGYIENYAQAYYGPKILAENNNSRGYKPIEITATALGGAGDYYLEFDIGSDFGVEAGQPFDISLFDITIVGADNKAKSGRVWSKAWGLNTNGSDKQVWASFYTMSTDGYLSKVYMSGAQPYRFVFGCNSFGSTRDYENEPNGLEKDRQSYPNKNTFQPEYPVFLTRPDDDFFGRVAQVPNIPKDLTFAGDAMSCEDLLFVVQLLYNEDATIELLMDTDNDGKSDMVIAEKLQAQKSQSRGYHYPWKDKEAIKEAGTYWYSPTSTTSQGCLKEYKLSLFDQRFTYSGVAFNVGDTIDRSITTINKDLVTVKNALKSASTNTTNTIGTENNPILIRDKDDLVALANAIGKEDNGDHRFFEYTIPDFLIDKETGTSIPATFKFDGSNGFKDVHFYLTAPTGSITLGSDWEGIGDENVPFKGVFRAGRYAPNPLVDNTDPDYAKQAGDQDTITINGASVGLFAYCDGATIDNVHVKGSINVGTNTPNNNKGDDTNFYIGGICSYAKNTSIQHCSNACEIENALTLGDDQYCNMGGIVGYAEIVTIDSCLNYASLTDEINSAYVGGIVGRTNGSSTIKFSYNIGKIISDVAGGIVGQIDASMIIQKCKNENSIEGGNYAGGIVGYNNGLISQISECENTGYVNAFLLGAILGATVDGATTMIQYCLDKNDISMASNSGITYTSTISTLPTNDIIAYYDGSGITARKDYYFENTSGESHLTLQGNGNATVTLNDTYFGFDEDANSYELYSTICCGKTWRMETAGRLYIDKSSFYIKWDGKDTEGNCVVGELNVKYQKNSGITHFPFFDPENINATETRTGGLKGLVVYRLSPIQDSIVNYDSTWYWTNSETDGINGASENQRAEKDADNTLTAKSKYGYQALPKDYYQTVNLSDEEYGIELNLYWDDRRIVIQNTTCDKTESNGLTIGKTISEKEIKSTTKNGSKCNAAIVTCKSSKYRKTYTTSDGKTMYYCTKWTGTCPAAGVWYDTTWNSYTACSGIENVSEGGYLGSKGGGHIFPESNFGNQHTINTWWNGVEVQSLKKLVMHEFSVGVLMPIEITLWDAKNLEKSVLLEWTTASEENNDYFTIERSTNGVTWVAIGKVKGAGTTTMENYYSFEDKKPVGGISYYRLKQTDYNGEYTYSSVKCINRPDNANDNFIVYTKQDANAFIVEGEVIAACPIEIYNTAGSRIYNVSFKTLSVNKVLINVNDLPAGTYFVKICNGSKAVVKNW